MSILFGLTLILLGAHGLLNNTALDPAVQRGIDSALLVAIGCSFVLGFRYSK